MPSAKEKKTKALSSALDKAAGIYCNACLIDEESLLPSPITDTPEKFIQKMAFLEACNTYIEE